MALLSTQETTALIMSILLSRIKLVDRRGRILHDYCRYQLWQS